MKTELIHAMSALVGASMAFALSWHRASILLGALMGWTAVFAWRWYELGNSWPTTTTERAWLGLALTAGILAGLPIRAADQQFSVKFVLGLTVSSAIVISLPILSYQYLASLTHLWMLALLMVVIGQSAKKQQPAQ